MNNRIMSDNHHYVCGTCFLEMMAGNVGTRYIGTAIVNLQPQEPHICQRCEIGEPAFYVRTSPV